MNSNVTTHLLWSPSLSGPPLWAYSIWEMSPLSDGVGIQAWETGILFSGSFSNPSFPLITVSYMIRASHRGALSASWDSCERVPEGAIDIAWLALYQLLVWDHNQKSLMPGLASRGIPPAICYFPSSLPGVALLPGLLDRPCAWVLFSGSRGWSRSTLSGSGSWLHPLTSEGHNVSEVLHLKSLFSGGLPSTWNHALLFHAPDKKKAPETTLLRPHAPLKLQLTVSFCLYSQTSREYWIPSPSPPPQPLFHLQPTVDLVSSWGIYQNCPCEVGHSVLSWFDFRWHLSSENMLSFGFCDMSQSWIFLILLWLFLSWFLLSATPLSNFFGWNYSEFCPRHSSYPMLISQKITSTSLTLNTMRELRSYSRMTHCSTGAVGFNMEGQVGSGEAQRREKLGFQPIESLNKQPGEISFLIWKNQSLEAARLWWGQWAWGPLIGWGPRSQMGLTLALTCVTPFLWNIQNRQIHGDRRQISGCQGLGGEETGIDCIMGTRFPFREINVFCTR